MFPVIGLVILLVMVFGGFTITGGALEPVLEAIPHEMLIIGGAALGSLVIGNSMKELKALGGGIAKVLKGPKYKKQDYLDTIFLVSKLMKMLRTEGPIALERAIFGLAQVPPPRAGVLQKRDEVSDPNDIDAGGP